MPAGRPTKYDPAYCERVIELMAEGRSKTAAAGVLGVCRDTLHEWANKHEEFSDAIKRAEALSAEWWETRGRELATGEGDGAPAMVIFGLKNRVRYDWADRVQTEHSGPDGGPIQTADVTPRRRLADFLDRRAEKSG